ncbi:MAG: signal peptidase I [Christensenellales bacterium]|jgi:signal peptidase I
MRKQYEPFVTDSEEDLDQTSRMQLKKEYRKRETRGWIFSLVSAILIALLLRFFVFEFIRVDGPSMEPTLFTDEYVFMEKVTYWFSTPQRGDIIICSFPDRTDTYVKRIIGIEGDTIQIDGGVLYINGIANYDYFADIMYTDMAPIIVPENHIFVMGDNRNRSMDSSSSSVGPLSYNMILGKALFVIWPVDKIHGL